MKVVEHCPPYTLAYYYDKSCSTSAAIYPNEDRTLKVLIGSLTTVINGTEAVHTKGAVSRTQCMRPDPVTGYSRATSFALTLSRGSRGFRVRVLWRSLR